MRLVLDVPRAWAPAITVTFGPSCLLPDQQQAWIDDIVTSGLPPGCRAIVARSTDGQTTDGWPVRVVEAQVLSGDRLVGARVIGVYAFLEHGASATVSAADLTGRQDEIATMLRAGRPDWRGVEVVALAELWD